MKHFEKFFEKFLKYIILFEFELVYVTLIKRFQYLKNQNYI